MSISCSSSISLHLTTEVSRFPAFSRTMASSEVPQELKDLFSWNPPELFPRPRPGQKMSKKTREPAFFDRHFDETLKLLHVRYLPTLVHDIAAIVDETVSDDVQFPPSDTFYSAAEINRALTNIEASVVDEKEVVGFYERTTATFCLPVASTLALGFPGLLRWTQSSNVSGYAIADGFLYFPDPKLSAGIYAQLEQKMGKETVKYIRSLAETRSSLCTEEFNNLAAGGLEVMLSISKLSKLPKFKWTSCNAPDCAALVKHQEQHIKVKKTKDDMGRDAKTTPWVLDQHPNNSAIPNVQGSSEDLSSRKRKRDVDGDSNNQSRATSSLSTRGILLMTPQANPSLAPRNPPLPTPEGSRKSSRIAQQLQAGPSNVCSSICSAMIIAHDKTLKITQIMPPPPLPVRGVQVGAAPGRVKRKGKEVAKGKVQGGNDDEDSDADEGNKDGDNEDPSYRDTHNLSALYIVQQASLHSMLLKIHNADSRFTKAWAQATRADCSIIVIQSGNYEFIGIRHRRSQTLYISDLIVPHACKDPSYGKLHVGLYIAAVRDAIDRASQRAAGSGGPSGGPTVGGSRGGGPSNHKDDGGGKKGGSKKKEDNEKPKKGGGSGTGRHGRVVAITAHNVAAKVCSIRCFYDELNHTCQRTIEIASCRDVILLYLQYGIYDSPAPSTFVRSGPDGRAPVPLPSRETVRNYRLEQCLSIVLESEIGHGATGEVLRGTLKVEASACVMLDVAVKLALGSERGNSLREEYKIYRLLTKSGATAGITSPLGLFDDVGGEACALVMPYEGTPLAAMPEFVLTSSYQCSVILCYPYSHF